MQQSTEKKLATIQGISPLTFEDEHILRASFEKKPLQYAHSFLYLLRASHGMHGSIGYKYITKEVKAIIGYRKNIVYITPIGDKTKGLKLKALCDILVQTTGCRILLKK